MKSKAFLVVSVIYLAFSELAALSFLFLPTILDPTALLGRFIFGCLVFLLIWLSVKIIRRSRLAWYIGAAVFFLLALSGLLAFGICVEQLFSPGDPRETLPFGTILLCGLNLVAYLLLYANRGVRQLFRIPVAGDASLER